MSPCYRVVPHIDGVLRHIGPEVRTIYCVDDACPGESSRHILSHRADARVVVLTHDRNQGVGAATKTGYRQATHNGAPIKEIRRYTGSSSVHYAGRCRMGSDPKTSMCDATGALHELSRVHVADASVFVNSPEKNPTLTLMALAWRSADQLAKKI